MRAEERRVRDDERRRLREWFERHVALGEEMAVEDDRPEFSREAMAAVARRLRATGRELEDAWQRIDRDLEREEQHAADMKLLERGRAGR